MARNSSAAADALYEQVVRTLPPQERQRLALRLIASAEPALPETSRPRSLLELQGLGRELWSGRDAQDYVTALRGEWDHRP
jgi:hypothetical protein